MTAQEVDVIVRVAGATLLLWAAFAPDSSDGRARRLFIPLAICLTGFLAGNTPEADLRLSAPVGAVASLLAGYAAVFMWWWCLAVFDQSFRPRGAVLATGIVWFVIASADRGLMGETLEGVGLSWVLIPMGLGMVGHLTWRLIRDRADDMVDRRRRARWAVAAVLGGQLLIDLVLDIALGLDWGPRAFTIAQNAAILIFTGWLLQLELAAAPPRPSRPASETTSDPILAGRLRTLMEVDQVYLDPTLTFDAFVRMTGSTERNVRRMINRELGHDHFRTFVNAYRVAEARRRLADPGRAGDKLIAVALDSGFASLASFNRVFKELEGRTPSAFRAAAPGFEERSADI